MLSPRGHIDALNELDDKRITRIAPLVPPQILVEDYPLTTAALTTVRDARAAIDSVVRGDDDRLLVIVGPCSVHDVDAAVEYGQRLREYVKSSGADAELVVVMRVYFEKPRTTVGWKGLINDPALDGSFQINKGLKLARSLLLRLNELGVSAACEFLDTITPQYFGDLVSWGAIGARTVESQVHRELASGLSVAIGFKNGTDGNLQVAVDAVRAASVPHRFLSVTKQGLSAIVETSGNDCSHVILRGGSVPNYSSEHVAECLKRLEASKVPASNRGIMVDCSHGNSPKKDFRRQVDVVKDICGQVVNDPTTGPWIRGVMIESNLVEGRQDIVDGTKGLTYGQSVTDPCVSWETTIEMLELLREAVRARRTLKK